MNYYWNAVTPTNNLEVIQAQDNINASHLLPIQSNSSIYEADGAIELCLVTNLEPIILKPDDIEYINSQSREHIDPNYVGMLKSKPIQKNKARPSRRPS